MAQSFYYFLLSLPRTQLERARPGMAAIGALGAPDPAGTGPGSTSRPRRHTACLSDAGCPHRASRQGLEGRSFLGQSAYFVRRRADACWRSRRDAIRPTGPPPRRGDGTRRDDEDRLVTKASGPRHRAQGIRTTAGERRHGSSGRPNRRRGSSGGGRARPTRWSPVPAGRRDAPGLRPASPGESGRRRR